MINTIFVRIIKTEKRVLLLFILCLGSFLSRSQDFITGKGFLQHNRSISESLFTTIKKDSLSSFSYSAIESHVSAKSIHSTDESVEINKAEDEGSQYSERGTEVFSTVTTSELFAYPYRRSIFDFNMQAESFSLRTNMLSWIALTPDLGIEWIINRDLGLVIDASWTSWKFGKMGYRYALWTIAPEFRYYAGEEKQWFIGLYYMMGDYNFRFSEIGHQGHYMGGGLSLGYALNLNNMFALDFHVGAGIIFSDCESYKVMYGYSIRDGKEMVKYPGVNKVGVTLVWKLGTNKYQRER